jgi:hypothetical protein
MGNSNKRLVYNAIQCPDGTVLVSRTKYDIKIHKDGKTGETYICDGGLEFLRRSVNLVRAVEKSVYDDAPFNLIRTCLCWRNNEKKHVPLMHLSREELESIINTPASDWWREMAKKEIAHRALH